MFNDSQAQSTLRPVGRAFKGVVIAQSSNKTIKVKVETTKTQAKYRKQYVAGKTYAVHDEKNQAVIGDKIEFRETRPISKRKRWRLVRVL